MSLAFISDDLKMCSIKAAKAGKKGAYCDKIQKKIFNGSGWFGSGFRGSTLCQPVVSVRAS
jgi:hypothetical protein